MRARASFFVPAVDRTLRCVDCAQPFVFCARDQIVFNRRGWRDPTRCSACRRTGRSVTQRDAEARTAADRISATDTAASRTCLDCHSIFLVEPRELQFLQRTFGDDAVLPRRCLTCRQARRTALDRA